MPQKFCLFNELSSYWSESWTVHKQILRYLLLMTLHAIEFTAALKIWDEKTIIIVLLHLFCEYKVTVKQISKAEVKIWSVDQDITWCNWWCYSIAKGTRWWCMALEIWESWYFDLVPYCALTAKVLQTNFMGMRNVKP